MTIIRPHHPLESRRVEVVFGGPTKITVRLDDGTTMRLPRAWTDADGRMTEASTERIFSVDALRELIHLVEAMARRA